MPDNTALMMELAKRQMAQEMPTELAGTKVSPMSNTEQALMGRDAAWTTPFNNVRYNPQVMSRLSQTDANDILAHELTHVRQQRETPFLSGLLQTLLHPRTNVSYGQNPAELEALQTEKDRAFREHRVPSGMMTMPPFEDGAPTRNTDIFLKPQK